jgi:hypothetical protein
MPPKLLYERLNSTGWCTKKKEIVDLELRNSRRLMYLATDIDFSSSGQELHRHCLEKRCLANQVDEQHYTTRHIQDGCNCPFITMSDKTAPDSDVICSILADEGIPLILSAGQEERPSVFEAVRWDNERPFIAISHVWSDGRGNPTQNSLPLCQLIWLQQAVNDLCYEQEKPVPFWIDTLCVPLTTKSRKIALSNMRSIYEKAHGVLVLDNALIGVNLSEISTRRNVHEDGMLQLGA